MKTKLNYFILVVFATIVSFTSCEKDDSSDLNTKSVFLKINKVSPTTYAEGDTQKAGQVTFTSGDIYFTNERGVILKHYTISSNAKSDTNINLGDVTAGEAISNLPGAVSEVYVVGNTGGLASSGSIGQIKEPSLLVEDQIDLNDVNLYGEATTLTPTGENQYSCDITLAPTVARIELADITCSGVIDGFKVEGIFVDNFYAVASVDGDLLASSLINNGTDNTLFTKNSSIYPSKFNDAIYDWYTTPVQSVAKVAKPDQTDPDKVWGYNIFANPTGSAVPRIVIRLKNISSSDPHTSYPADQFLTIKGIKANGTTLTEIKPGYIYKINPGALVFTENDLTSQPNLQTVDVEVEVKLADWEVVNITPEL